MFWDAILFACLNAVAIGTFIFGVMQILGGFCGVCELQRRYRPTKRMYALVIVDILTGVGLIAITISTIYVQVPKG